MRLRVELAKKLNVPVAKVNSMVLDEDGDTSFENFDESIVDGKALLDYSEINDDVLAEIETDVRKKGCKIIANKGATFYDVAMMLTQIVSAVLDNRSICLPLSAPINVNMASSMIFT